MAVLSQLKVHGSRFLCVHDIFIHEVRLPARRIRSQREEKIYLRQSTGVLIPLLFICLCATAWFKMQRVNGKEKPQRRSEAVNKRIVVSNRLLVAEVVGVP